MMRHAKEILLFALMLMLLSVGVAHAQWVFLARAGLRVINSIASQAQSPSQYQGQGADAASVMLDADPDKVYNVAVRHLRENPDLQIVWQDDARRAIAFPRGASPRP
jgi:hypothetical protein